MKEEGRDGGMDIDGGADWDDEEEEEKEGGGRVLEVELERRAGGAGQYAIDLNKFKLLSNQEWNNVSEREKRREEERASIRATS